MNRNMNKSVHVDTKGMRIRMMLRFRCLKILSCKLPNDFNDFMLQLWLFMDETEIN